MQTWNRRKQNSQLLKKFIFFSLLVGLGIFIRNTQASWLMEGYYWLSRPFQSDPQIPQAIAQNAQVQELEIRLGELEQENQYLQKLLGFSKTMPKNGITTQIIGRSADQWWQKVTLNKGTKQGIKQGDVAMTVGGLVGRVTEVTPNTSRVLLISDPFSRVGVTVSRSRQMGFMKGLGTQEKGLAVIEFFNDVPDVKPGDMITTSTYSQLFPASLPVGRVKSVNLSKTPAPEALIELSASMEFLEWVIVYPHQPVLDVLPKKNN
jgi:rod shape-determining protein MreC